MSEFLVPNLEDLSWLTPYLPLSDEDKEVAKVYIESLNKAGGLHASMRRVVVELPTSKTIYILKTFLEGGLTQSKNLGCAREAFFYNQFRQIMKDSGIFLPEIIFSYGKMETGSKTIVMEDLSTSGVQSGYFFGPGSPLNWDKDLEALTKLSPVPVTAKDITLNAFEQIAKMHRTFWKDESLLSFSWLRCQDWLIDQGEDAWQASQNFGLNSWNATKAKIAAGTSQVNWNPKLVVCVDQAMENINWSKYLQSLHQRPWTLVHGDFHPANALWVWSKENPHGHGIFVDWEMVGLGSGPQDIAQYLISHMSPSLRREIEKELVQHYYDILTQAGHTNLDPSVYTFEQCWSEYVRGGIERWIWLLAILTAMCPDSMVQYFHDQLFAFMEDHNFTEKDVEMPRV